MEWWPYYNDLKMVGHLACAFLAAMLSGSLLFVASLTSKNMRLFERSYAFSLWSSALIWVFPMFFNVSEFVREILFYGAIIVAIVIMKFVYGRSCKKSLFLWVAFLGGQALVFFLIYKKVF